MFLVEVRRVVEGEEELAVVGARLILVRHGHLAAMVELDARVDLVSKRFPVYALSTLARAGGISSLNHELPNDPVEDRVVVVLDSTGGRPSERDGVKMLLDTCWSRERDTTR